MADIPNIGPQPPRTPKQSLWTKLKTWTNKITGRVETHTIKQARTTHPGRATTSHNVDYDPAIGHEHSLFEHTVDVTTKVQRGAAEIQLDKLSFKSPQYHAAGKLIDDTRTQLEHHIISTTMAPFKDMWLEIHNDVLKGDSYDVLKIRYEKKWNRAFQTTFKSQWAHIGTGLKNRPSKDEMKTAEFGTQVQRQLEDAHYKEFKAVWALKWDREIASNDALTHALLIVDRTKTAEALRRQNTLNKLSEGKGIDMSDKISTKQHNLIMEASPLDYAPEEIKAARSVVRKFHALAKKQMRSNQLDSEVWNILHTREPVLAKAIELLSQENIDRLGLKFQRDEFIDQIRSGKISPDELAKARKQLSTLEAAKDGIGLFLKTLNPLNQLDAPAALGTPEPETVEILPIASAAAFIQEQAFGDQPEHIGNRLANRVREKVFNPINNVAADMVEGVTQEVKDRLQYGTWDVDKNKYIVGDYTAQQKDGRIKAGIKSLMQRVAAKPKELEDPRWIPWLTRFGKKAAKGALGGAAIGLRKSFSLQGAATGAAVGAATGVFTEYHKNKIKTFVAGSIPGAAAGIGVAVALFGAGSLLTAGALLFVGVAAVLFGLFGVYVLHYTKLGNKIQDAVQRFAWSADLAFVEQYQEKIDRANLGRKVFNKARDVALERQRELGYNVRLAEDKRYWIFMDALVEEGLSKNVQLAAKMAIQENPHILSEPDTLLNEIHKSRVIQNKESILAELEAVSISDKKSIAEKVTQVYRTHAGDILQVGIDARLQSLWSAISDSDPTLKNVLHRLQFSNALENPTQLNGILKEAALDPERVDEAFSDDNESGLVSRAMGAATNALFSLWTLDKTDQLDIALEEDALTRDDAIIGAIKLMQSIGQDRSIVADEGQLKSLLIRNNLDVDLVFNIFNKFDEQNKTLGTTLKSRMRQDLTGIEKHIQKSAVRQELLADSIIQDAQRTGELKPDEDLLTAKDLTDIETLLPDNDHLTAIRNEYASVPGYPKRVSDAALKLRLGFPKELSHEQSVEFARRKEDYQLNDLPQQQAQFVRRHLLAQHKRDAIQAKKDTFVNNKLKTLTAPARTAIIAKQNERILNEYQS